MSDSDSIGGSATARSPIALVAVSRRGQGKKAAAATRGKAASVADAGAEPMCGLCDTAIDPKMVQRIYGDDFHPECCHAVRCKVRCLTPMQKREMTRLRIGTTAKHGSKRPYR